MAALPKRQQFFSVDDIATILDISRRSVLNALHRGELEGFRIGKIWRVTREKLQEFIERPGKELPP